MDEQRRRIREDLTGLLRGEVRCDALTVALYSTDASLYQIEPIGVVFPRDPDDVVALVGYAADAGIPLTPRGAGSQVAGGALGSGLIVDFTRHMRQMELLEDGLVWVQAGATLHELNAFLRPFGRYFPPDPANANVTTVGGMLAVDAAGSRSVRVGSTRDHVHRIEMVLASAHAVDFGIELVELNASGHPLPATASDANQDGIAPNGADTVEGHETAAVKRDLLRRLAYLLKAGEPLIERYQPADLVRNVSGYCLRGVLADGQLRMPRLLVGSEGTLGLFTAAVLHSAPLPQHRGIVLLLFGQLEAALRTAQELIPLQPSACDLLDRRLLALGRESDPRWEQIIPKTAEAMLIVEQTGYSTGEARRRIALVVQRAREQNRSIAVAYEAYEFDEVEFVWSLSRRVVPMLSQLPGESRPLPFIEDIAVPPAASHEFLQRVQKVLQKHRVTASFYAHAAAGQIHIRPFLPPPTPDDAPRYESLARDVYQAAFAVGGTVSGEHGNGLARTAFIRSQYGPLYRLFQQVKDLFDPKNVMNPGKIISDDAHLTVRHFRPPIVASPDLIELQLQWTPEDMGRAAAQCNGCAQCRTLQPDQRMCPFFRVDPIEEASPRAKANAMRHLATGALPAALMGSPSLKRLADLCFNCKQCLLECPSGVDIPRLVLEAKAADVAANGLDRTNWVLARAHLMSELACMVPRLANWIVSNPALRWLMERVLGITRQRRFPRFARSSFLRSEARRGNNQRPRSGGRPPVVLFVDYFVNFHAPHVARALIAVLRHHGQEVYVPPGQVVSGMTLLSVGEVRAARRLAETNVRELVELAREGSPIVCPEPTAALCLKLEYPLLLDHPDVQLIADQVVEAGQFLQRLHRQGELQTDFRPLDLEVVYHAPCHLKALNDGTPLYDLLNLIPKLRIRRIECGCSGMGGTFGWRSERFEESLRIGAGLIEELRGGRFDAAASECGACRTQMAQGTDRPIVHPIELLAAAYGVMPNPIGEGKDVRSDGSDRSD
ncbi:MAG: anaerobic glycerol-3-phosphate dehydrogenase subunit C [Planctomycetes bacterium]|nr:anaerobic glycerol-3-phosphate dehydrogenase subunit C [Planctomycetota bacterium]